MQAEPEPVWGSAEASDTLCEHSTLAGCIYIQDWDLISEKLRSAS